MRLRLFGTLILLLLAIMALSLRQTDGNRWIVFGCAGVALLILVMLFRTVLKPAHVVRTGLDLIAGQDFNNRLVSVGETEADRLVKLFNTMIDKLRQERLKGMERENFLQLLVEASPMGVVMLDFDERITMVNPSFLRMTGLSSEEEVVGREIQQLGSELALRMKNVPLGKSEEIRQGDARRYRCFHLSFIRSGFRREFYLIESLTEEMLKAEKGAYEKVIRIISHEVNNTMGGVSSVLESLYELTENEEIREVIESCTDRCEQLSRFINSYADVVRVPMPLKRETDLNAMLEGMIPFLQGLSSPAAEVRFQPCHSPLTVVIDRALIQQVVINIVKNAVESITGENRKSDGCSEGWIEINTREEGEKKRAVMEIVNNGESITAEVSDQLFSPFFTTKRAGRGIGLTLLSEILNRHEAVYSLKTGGDGLTRFTIIFSADN